MAHSPHWEVKRFSGSQEIPQIWWNQKVHYRIYKYPPLVLTLSQIKLVHAPRPTSWRSILILSSHLHLGLLPSAFPTKTLYTPLLSIMCATCPVQLIVLDLITQIVFGEKWISLSSSLSSFLHSPVTSSLLGPNILLSTLFSDTLSLRSSLNVSDEISYPYKATGTNVPYILESNPHPFYSFRGVKNQMRIRISCGLDSQSWAGFCKAGRAAVRAVRTIK